MIIINDENSLRFDCEDVLPEEVGHLIELLDDELKNSARLGNPGIGLAATQIGINKKIAIVRTNDIKLDLINCKIDAGYDLTLFKEEGCLSFPGRVEDTMRYQEVHISNNLISPKKFIITGLAAVVCQHEIGHYNKDLFFDHMIQKPKTLINKIKLGPNDPCFCGIIDPATKKVKKYKKCCGKP